MVGFAAETGDDNGSVLDHARAKLARKGCDLLVVNDVGGGAVFGSPDNEAVVLSASGEAVSVPRGSKESLAHVVWDQVGRAARRTTRAGRVLRPLSTGGDARDNVLSRNPTDPVDHVQGRSLWLDACSPRSP